MRFSFYVVVAGVCLSAVPMAARADEFTISGTNTISFSLPTSPVPDSYTNQAGFTVNNVDVTVNGKQETESVLFFEDGIAIGSSASVSITGFLMNLNVENPISEDYSIMQNTFLPFSAPLYKGSESSPTFLLGTYGLDDILGNGDETLSITADVATTPEPSSFALLGTGLLGVAGMLRKRFA